MSIPNWMEPRAESSGSDSLIRQALRRDSMLWKTDWILIAAAGMLTVLGALMVYSATKGVTSHGVPQGATVLKKDMLFIVLAAVLAGVLTVIDYRTLRSWVPVLYLLSVIALAATFVIGTDPNGSGSKSWISVGAGFLLQPAEFAKVAIVIGMAMILGERAADDDSRPTAKDVGIVAILAGVPILLVLAQPDFGSAMVLVATVFGVLIVAGLRLRWIVLSVIVGAAGAVLAVQLQILKRYQLDRFSAWLHPVTDSTHAGYNYSYQVAQARLAIGSGGLTGQGLFNGTMTQSHRVPIQESDFIFTVAGEELGLLGALLVIILLGIVLWRAIRIAKFAPDPYGRLVAAGVACWFTIQSFENIGMTIGLMPMTGIPLPFVSYGGSAMLACGIGIGLLLNVHMSARLTSETKSRTPVPVSLL